MNHLDILLPFGLPPVDTARDLIRECRAPALAMLLSRTGAGSGVTPVDPFARSLSHEAWISRQFGLTGAVAEPGTPADTSPPAAHAAMAALGLPAAQGHWFIVQATHIHIARDHLVLTDHRQLALDPQEARALFDAAEPLCAEIGKTLLYGSPDTWFLRVDDWPQLRTATPDAASGRNVDIWMPVGEGDRAWRKLQNEIQMHWFTHPVNEQREALGLKPVNSLWLWGGADPDAVVVAAAAAKTYDAGFNFTGWMQLFEQAVATAHRDVQATGLLNTPAERALLLLDTLTEPGLTNEWGYWLERMEALDRDWFAPLLAALRTGQLRSLRLILAGQDRLACFSSNRNTLRKFWIKPSLQGLAK